MKLTKSVTIHTATALTWFEERFRRVLTIMLYKLVWKWYIIDEATSRCYKIDRRGRDEGNSTIKRCS